MTLMKMCEMLEETGNNFIRVKDNIFLKTFFYTTYSIRYSNMIWCNVIDFHFNEYAKFSDILVDVTPLGLTGQTQIV